MKNWYIIQTFSGFEQKVAETLKDTIKKKEKLLEDKIEDVLVPTHEVTEVKRGKRVQRKKKYFPSYVLVKMEMNKDLYHMIKNINKVTGFLGTTGIPAPVPEKEINKIMGRIKEGTLAPKTQVTFDIGEQVKVCEGPFASFSGLVEEVDEEKSRLKVSVSIFGRPTPIDLEYNQVEKF
jgi:transcriptional antiterminator NusG